MTEIEKLHKTLREADAVVVGAGGWTVNLGEAFTVDQIKDRSIVIDADIADVLNQLAVSS